MAKIKSVTGETILFDDGSTITYDHERDCCEDNYADFTQLDDICKNTDFDTKNMIFESVEDSGFRFGNENKMFFVPCYSNQNGYYSSDIDIYYNGKRVLNFACDLDIF
jgi:hypothetical protein